MVKIITEKRDTVHIDDIDENKATFAVLKDSLKVVGMVIKDRQGWITKINSHGGCSGHYPTFKDCIKMDLALYDFYQDIYVK